MSTPAFRRFANPLSIWIALLAIVLQSVMPMVAQARMQMPVAVARGDAMAEGTAGGMAVGMAMHHAMPGHGHGTGDASSPPSSADTAASSPTDMPIPSPVNPHAMHGEACPYCRVHLDAVSLPPVPNPHWVLLVTVVHRPIADEVVPVPPDAWSPTRPRGPPSTS